VKLRFDCVFHHVSDLEESVRFYRDLLGLRLKSRDAIARFDIDGVRFELVPEPEGRPTSPGGAHLCLGVDDIEAARDALKEQQVESSEPHRVPGGFYSTFCDPDGNEIYLWQNEREEG
jgi:predicted enzyme related to lactoylglutathione lyase